MREWKKEGNAEKVQRNEMTGWKVQKKHKCMNTKVITILPTKRLVTDGQPPLTRQCRGG
jgi:hypothetical protein